MPSEDLGDKMCTKPSLTDRVLGELHDSKVIGVCLKEVKDSVWRHGRMWKVERHQVAEGGSENQLGKGVGCLRIGCTRGTQALVRVMCQRSNTCPQGDCPINSLLQYLPMQHADSLGLGEVSSEEEVIVLVLVYRSEETISVLVVSVFSCLHLCGYAPGGSVIMTTE